MSAESPAEYVERLRAENRTLRRGLIELTREKQQLEQALVKMLLESRCVLQRGDSRPGVDVD